MFDEEDITDRNLAKMTKQSPYIMRFQYGGKRARNRLVGDKTRVVEKNYDLIDGINQLNYIMNVGSSVCCIFVFQFQSPFIVSTPEQLEALFFFTDIR